MLVVAGSAHDARQLGRSYLKKVHTSRENLAGALWYFAVASGLSRGKPCSERKSRCPVKPLVACGTHALFYYCDPRLRVLGPETRKHASRQARISLAESTHAAALGLLGRRP
jgi:hypothetical protein